MKNIDSYRKRFFGLLESTMGDVKPLIMEQSLVPKRPGPNLTCSDSFCEGTYVGDEWGPNGEDIGHRYSNTVANDVGEHLKNLYNNGKFSKVDLNNIEMNVEGYGTGTIKFYVKVPFLRVSDKCDAMTSFDHSGSWAGTPQLDNRKNELSKLLLPGDTFEISKPIKSAGLTEYWIQWRSSIQSECGGGQSVSTQKETKTITHNSNPETLRQGLKSLGQIYNPKLILNPDSVSVMYEKTGDQPINLSYVYSNAGEKEKVLEKAKRSNNVERETEYNVGPYEGYIIFIKP